MVSPVQIHQALHGYEDGHQLLASSTHLTSDQEALLLIMSDLSGASFRSGYEKYLTGYPLRGSSYYCFARTWFAPEMPRPGCVWTHTFLIRGEDLPNVADFRDLAIHFLRPDSDFNWKAYEQPLIYTNSATGYSNSERDCRPILWGLYETDRRVVLINENSEEYERDILAVFQQQWPRLRRSIRFCTGALSARDTAFDISVSPPEVSHSIGPTSLAISNRETGIWQNAKWTDLANRALNSPDQFSNYRQFLWRFGPDFANGRAAFRPLTELFQLLESSSSQHLAEEALAVVRQAFPLTTDGRQIKSEMFGENGRYVRDLGSESDILRLLVTHPGASSIDAEISQICRRAEALTSHTAGLAAEIAVLAMDVGGENAEKYLEGFLEGAGVDGDALISLPQSVLPLLVSRQPQLLAKPAFWSQMDGSLGLSRLALWMSPESELLGTAIVGIIEAKAWKALHFLIDRFERPAIEKVLQAVDRQEGKVLNIPETVVRQLVSEPSIVSSLLETRALGPRALTLISSELDPRASYIRRMGASPWSEAVGAEYKFPNTNRKLRSSIFLLSLGLGSWDMSGASLVAANFDAVLSAANHDSLEAANWDRLVPSLDWYGPDKTLRLIKTAANAFKSRPWPKRYFGKVFKNPEAFSLALTEIKNMWGGSRFLVELFALSEKNDVELSEAQKQILRGYSPKRR